MDTDGNGRFNRDERDPRIQPVHWVIYEWDGPGWRRCCAPWMP